MDLIRRAVRRTAGRAQIHSEAGYLAAGVAITIGFAAVYMLLPMAVGAATDISDWAHGRWNPVEQRAASSVSYPFIGPSMVDITHGNDTQTQCVIQAAAAAGLQYGDKGWSAP